MNDVRCLIVSSLVDYATDLVCLELERRGASYFRINRDQFSQFNMILDVNLRILQFEVEGEWYCFRNELRNSIYYRAPTFLRAYGRNYSLDEQVFHSQWSSFLRNLTIFDRVTWMNNPVNTYRAENKMLQLSLAARCGLRIPRTVVGNTAEAAFFVGGDALVMKSIDTAQFTDGTQGMFTYTEAIGRKEIESSSFEIAPVCFQELVAGKTDIRATYIGARISAFAILDGSNGIEGDWRKTPKERLRYVPVGLPEEVLDGLMRLMDILGLVFGGIDLMECDGHYYFVEVNPTGEWAWLQECAGVDLCGMIVDYLDGEEESRP